MTNKILLLVVAVTCIIFCVGCQSAIEKDGSREELNAVYYWRTTLEMGNVERDFLRTNNVQRAYVRFFDIVVDKSPIAMDAVVPNATLQVKDTIPVEEIVPTIYITTEAMAEMKSNEAMWAEKIVKRIYNMCSYNELGEPNEVQLDCDWTAQTDSAFFALCSAVKGQLRERNPRALLSATIRLHQLAQTSPPVDYGVLMLYNTGSFNNPDETNSIISVERIKPYLKYLADYPLHLDYAYPIFSWSLVYRNDKFKGIISSNNMISNEMLSRIADHKYEVVKDTVVNGIHLYQGDMIRREDAPFKTLMEVNRLIGRYSRSQRHSVILYHLDTQNISNYSNDEFKQIYK